MTSFNEGIEAAYQEALKCVGESTDPISGAESWMAQHIADRIADLKRPEPSETAKLEWGEPDKSAYGYALIATDDCDVTLGYFDQLYNCWRREDGSVIEEKVVATMPIPPAPL